MSVPVKEIGNTKWADLTVFGDSHDICGEKVRPVNERFSFAGGHRVRLYRFTKNVHFRILEGMDLDISAVTPATNPPRRRQRR